MNNKEKLTYIPVILQESLVRAVQHFNEKLRQTKLHLAEHGEGYEDLMEYIKRGHNWKLEQRLAEVRKYQEDTNCPKYLRAQQEQMALADLGEHNIAYWRDLDGYFTMQDLHRKLNLATDIKIDNEGNWVVSEKWIKQQQKQDTHTLSEEKAKDYAELGALLKKVLVFCKDRKYQIYKISHYLERYYGKDPQTFEIDLEWLNEIAPEPPEKI